MARAALYLEETERAEADSHPAILRGPTPQQLQRQPRQLVSSLHSHLCWAQVWPGRRQVAHAVPLASSPIACLSLSLRPNLSRDC